MKSILLFSFLLFLSSTGKIKAENIFSNENSSGVLTTAPAQPTVFTVSEPMKITMLRTYHYNSGKGVAGGGISLRSSGGVIFGPYKAEVYNKYYLMIKPDLIFPADKYTIVVAENSTWSNNVKSGNRGFALVQGEKLDFGTKGPVNSIFQNRTINWTKGPVKPSVFKGIESDNSKLLSFSGPGFKSNEVYKNGNDYNTIENMIVGNEFEFTCYYKLPQSSPLIWKDYIFFTDNENFKYLSGTLVDRGYFKNFNAHLIQIKFKANKPGSGYVRVWAFDYESKQLIGPKLIKYIIK
jgi:hypothetical protein